LNSLFTRFLNLVLRFRWASLLVALVFCLAGAWYGNGIPIRLSLQELLPADRESILDFNAVSKEVGGVGYLGVVVGPLDPKGPVKPESLLPAVAEAVKALPDIRYVYFEREAYSLRNKALYTLDRKDFDDLMVNAEVLLKDGKEGGLLDLGLEDESDTSAKVTKAREYFDDLRERKLGGERQMDARDQRFYLSKDGAYAMLWAKPAFDSENLARSRGLVESADKAVRAALPPDTPFQLWGRAVNNVRDTEQIQSDIGLTSIISMIAIAAALIWGLGSVRAAALTIVSVSLAMGWTIGFAKLAVGQINIITGFLLAILGGLGVEYGIHLIRRYYQERASGSPHATALESTFQHTGRALLSAALTSAGAFLILSFSDFRGFSELGKIAGFGVLAIYAVYMLTFPAIGSWLRDRPRFGKSLEIFGWYPFSLKWRWLVIPLAAILAWGLGHAEFEYNFERMRQLSARTVKLNQLVNEIVRGRSTTPAALLADSAEQASGVRAWLDANKERGDLDQVMALPTLVPPDASERDERLADFRDNLRRISDDKLRDKTGLEPGLVREWIAQRPYTKADLPVQLQDAFGQSGNLVLVYTKLNLSHADGLRRFDGLLKDAKKEFPGLKIGSDAGIFVEILDHILNDGRIVLLLFVAGSLLVLWLDFGSWREAVSLEMQLILGVALLVGLMGFFAVPFSILNVAMIPAVLAAGIDMGVHVRHRELEDGESPIRAARHVAQAVQLGAITTMFGFGALFFAQAKMLKGIAWISVLGQVAMYLVCMFLWPVVREWLRSRRATPEAAIASSET
jgi:predicted RND superfamily exporter protein